LQKAAIKFKIIFKRKQNLLQTMFKKIFLLTAFGIALSLNALAADNAYYIEGVAVNVTARTPSDARNLAGKTARRDAFLILLARLSIEEKTADKISDEDLSDMVRSEQITDEKIAAGNYSGTFNITFAKDFVEHVLAKKNSKFPEDKEFAEDSPTSYLIIPVKILKKKILLWEEGNDWRIAVEKAIKSYSDPKAKSPAVDIDDMSVLNSDNVNQISYGELEPLFYKYKVDMIYTVSFIYDDAENHVTVGIHGFSKLKKMQGGLNFTNSNKVEESELQEKIASKVVDYISKLHSKKAKNGAQDLDLLAIEIPVSRLGDWLMIKNRIERSGLVSKLNIDAISHDYVKISIAYDNSNFDIIDAFAKIGLTLTKRLDESFLLTVK